MLQFIDINKRFTEIVSEYLSRGYVFNADTMCGHQGEVAKVDLTDGHEVVRVYMERFRGNIFSFDPEGIKIVVGRNHSDEIIPGGSCGWSGTTMWTSKLEEIYQESYYVIAENRHGITWYGTEEQAKEACTKRETRFLSKVVEDEISFPVVGKRKAIAKKYARKHMDRKRFSSKDMKILKTDSGYYICHKSDRMRLH